jgi:ATP-binding protein involved in chromosome partitioning
MRIFTDLDSAVGSGAEFADETARIAGNLAGVRAIVALASAKGGVGKSAVAVNLGGALALRGRKVAILDADLNSPSVAGMLGIKLPRGFPLVDGIEPIAGPLGLRIVASNLLPGGEAAPVAFGPAADDLAAAALNGQPPQAMSAAGAMLSMLARTRFGPLDLLIIDLPPGTAEVYAIAKVVESAGVVLVTHPTAQSERATRHAIDIAAAVGAPIIGMVENFLGYNCDGCRQVRPLLPDGAIPSLAQEFSLPLLARLPFDPLLAESTDRGALYVHGNDESPLAKAFADLAQAIEHRLIARAEQSRPGA